MQQQKPPPVTSIFCAPAPSDTSFLAQWERHLLPRIQVGRITVWSEQHLMAGETRLQQINDSLDHAQVIVFLLSAEFFASDECMALVERALKGSARVIPLLLRPVDWKTSKLAHLTCLPANGQFVTTWDNLDQALHTCVDDLWQLLGLSLQSRNPAPVSALQNQNRSRMLRRLRRTYEDLMSQSLQGAAWLELGITSKPGAVQNAANVLLRIKSRTEQLLPPGTSITQAYDEVEHELLILGEPGAGKSTLLLDLAEHLVVRAEQDETHPLPVILPLSSWAIKRGSLEDWIAEQMSEIYDVPRKLSVRWVQEGHVLPLLDGLDEMDKTARPVCIAAINTYHCDRMAPLVICSRTTECETATESHRLILQGAVMVQPLTHEDVDAYLLRAGKPGVALRSALKKNEALRLLSTTPLMLNILILTYQDSSVCDLPNRESLLQKQVWDDYVERMVERKGNSKRYPLGETRSQLDWLARQMREHNQTVFYLEHVQPDWLTDRQRCTYDWLGVRLPAILIGALVSLLLGWFFLGPLDWGKFLTSAWTDFLSSMTVGGMLGGLLLPMVSSNTTRTAARRWATALPTSIGVGLVIGWCQGWGTDTTFDAWLLDGCVYSVTFSLSCLLLQFLLPTSSHCPSPTSSGRWAILTGFAQQLHLRRTLLVALLIGLSYGLATGLSYSPYYIPHYDEWSIRAGLSNGLIHTLIYWLASMLISVILGQLQGGIRPTERVSFSWRSLRSRLFVPAHLRLTLILSGAIIVFIGLGYWPSSGLSDGLAFGLGYALGFGVLCWLLLGLYQSIAQERIEDQDRQVPNQGLRQSLHNSLLLALISGILIGGTGILSSILYFGLGSALSASGWLVNGLNLTDWLSSIYLKPGLSIGLDFGLNNFWPLFIVGSVLVWMTMGGLAVWRHYLVRFLLHRAQTFPLNASRFLDDATARILLQRLGGGYRFTHRLLLDFLADADTGATSSPNESSTQFPNP